MAQKLSGDFLGFSIREFYAVDEHTIFVQSLCVDLDDHIVSFIFVDQLLARIYNALDE